MAQVGNRDSLVRADALVAVPWANGGGVTRVIANLPQFRLSLATIADEGPFSIFPGIVRHLALLSGQIAFQPYGVVINANSPPLTFPGTDAVVVSLPGGPALALNLMVPTGAPPLRLERTGGGVFTDAVAVFACDAIDVDGLALEPHDTLFPDGPVRVTGRALVVRFNPIPAGDCRDVRHAI